MVTLEDAAPGETDPYLADARDDVHEAIAATEVAVVRMMASALREISEGRVPK